MAEMIEACGKGNDHDTNPLKVETGYTVLEINMEFYSRNREIGCGNKIPYCVPNPYKPF